MKKLSIASLVLSLALAAGCTGGSSGKPAADGTGGQTQAPASGQPVTLKVAAYSTGINQEHFNKVMKPNVEKKFPNIKLEWVDNLNAKKLDEIITAGTLPDVLISGYLAIQVLLDKDISLDLNPLIKKNNFKTDVFEKTALQSVSMFSDKGQLYALPFSANQYALYFNKDIFDRQGVEYPKTNMTWDEVMALSKKVNAPSSDGKGIRGLVIRPAAAFVSRGLSLNVVDPKTDKAILNNDQWLKVFRLLKDAYSMPGNESIQEGWNSKAFLEGRIAMFASFGGFGDEFAKTAVNWDVTTYPSFAESPGKNMEGSANIYTIVKTSQHPEEAFQALSYLAADKEVQMASARLGMPPVVKLDKIGENFAQDLPQAQGKNIAALFAAEPREPHIATRYENLASTELENYFKQYLEGKMNEREALSTAETEANKKIESEKKN